MSTKSLAALVVLACAACAPQRATPVETGRPPEPPSNPIATNPAPKPWRWQTAKRVEALHWSRDGLKRVAEHATSLGSTALMIVTDEQIVLSLGEVNTNFRVHSIRKSLLSLLFGIYVDEGKIQLSSSLSDLGINDQARLTDVELRATVEDLLGARSGVYLAAASEIAAMRDARPARGSHDPGSFWYYNNWDFNALGTIFEQETGEGIFDAFARRIAGPIGLQDFSIGGTEYATVQYSVHRGYRFRISCRDLARVGLLVLRQGRWQGKQIVPEWWLTLATSARSETGRAGTKSGYGYLWWVVPSGAAELAGIPPGTITASGHGGQRLVVLPSINTVVVHQMNTEVADGPRISTTGFDALLATILAARSATAEPIGSH